MKRPILFNMVKTLAARLSNWELIRLPLLAGGSYESMLEGKRLLALKYSYRASTQGKVTYQLGEAAEGLEYSLYTTAIVGARPRKGIRCLSISTSAIGRGAVLEVDMVELSAQLNGQLVPASHCERHPARKFIAEVQLIRKGKRFRRICFHYLPFENKPIGREYYYGDDYVNYPEQTDVEDALDLVQTHCSAGRLLDVGCALGVYTKAFLDAGFDAFGVDISDFAVAEAAKRIGKERVQCVNLDCGDVPFEGKFDVFWMWDVLEHSSDPRALLQKLDRHAAPGALIFMHTSNADSLTRRIFGRDWEGYSDYSHHGVDQITSASLTGWLDEFHWRPIDWRCAHIWVGGADPVLARLRDVFHRIPELGTLLNERDLGDMLTVVAKKQVEGNCR